jgi:hypothetical protein
MYTYIKVERENQPKGNEMKTQSQKIKLIEELSVQANCSKETAKDYLDAEEWLYFEALLSLRADRKNK